MTLRPPLYVANGAAGVTAPQDARLAMAGLLTGAPGILTGTGAAVTGSTSGPNMQYIVPAEVFATVRGVLASDGLYLLANDGNVTVSSGTPAPGSGTRWDLIWVRALNANDGFGDANSTPVFGVTVGTSGGSPTKPYASVPAGAHVLCESLVGTSIANASLATLTQVAGNVGVRGVILPVTGGGSPFSSTYPAAPFVGQVVYDQTLNQAMLYDGTGWERLPGALVATTSGAVGVSSSGATEGIGSSGGVFISAVPLLASRTYVVEWQGRLSASAAAGALVARLRVATGAVTSASTLIGGTQVIVSAPTGASAFDVTFRSQPWQPASSATWNIALTAAQASGASNCQAGAGAVMPGGGRLSIFAA